MAMKLFQHNSDAYNSALEMLEETHKAAIIHPTGTGKSFIGFKLCEDNPKKTICWLSPSEYIFKTQIENWKNAGGDKLNNILFFTYAKLMGLSADELSEIKPDYIILDEFHRCGAEMWGQGVNRLIAAYPNIPVLGLSATAIRYLDNQRNMANEIFDGNIASEMTLGEAIVRGILKAPTYILSVYSYAKDLRKYQSRVNRAKSKAVRDEAQKYLDALRRSLDKSDGLDTVFKKHIKAKDGKYIVFCSNVEHMKEMVKKVPEWFGSIDTNPSVYVVYSDNAETSKEFKSFKEDQSKHLKLLFCIDMLNEGVHVEKIDGVILFRPTVSPIIYKQQIGRALSASKDKEPVIFDVVNNIENLYSIGTIEQEMQVAISYYRFLGLERNIVNERFKIYDDLQNARAIFDSLNETLTASWDLMYEHAKSYYEKHGNLEVERRYKTKDGYTLGNWIFTQRKVYKGEQYGTLGEDKIKKLEAIGMVWDNYRDLSWQRFFNAAREYYEENGNLNVIKDYVTKDGIKLGSWICRLRLYKNSNAYSKYLTDDMIKMLEEIGMIWDKNDWLFDRNFAAAKKYYEKNGDLIVPNKYVTEDGLRLWSWLQQLKHNRRHGGGAQLTEEQIKRLDSIGMIWDKKFDISWKRGYEKVLEYCAEYGNINVPTTYKTSDGFSLGGWLSDRREHPERLSDEQRGKLDSLGMIWVKEDSWEVRYALAKKYFEQHGNLKMPSNYKTNGIWLNKWLNEQKQIYKGKRKNKSFTPDQIKRLEEIGIIWDNEAELKNETAWEVQFEEAAKYYKQNGNLNVSENYRGTNGKKLSVWIINQRRKRKQDKLTKEQVERLDAIGMVWEIEDAWEKGFKYAEQYYKDFGDLSVSTNYVCADGYKLGTWITNQRNNYNNPTKHHKVSKEQAKRLESIGMKWRRGDVWEKSFGIAKQYYEQNGNLEIVRGVKINGLNLYDWIVEQRKNYKKGKLSADRIEKLNSIGMVWAFDDRWGIAFGYAEQYFKENGNLLVNISYVCPNGYKLGLWISAQRSRYNNPTTHHQISESQIKRLESIGMQWRVQGSEWEDNFNLAKKYYEKHGNLKIPRGFKFNGAGINLNTWLITQRGKRKKGKLSEEQIQKLDSIGMIWDDRNINSELAVTLSDNKYVAVG